MPWMLDVRHSIPEWCTIRFKMTFQVTKKTPWAEFRNYSSHEIFILGEQNEQISLKMSELERAVHVERENLRKEIYRNRQEVAEAKNAYRRERINTWPKTCRE